MTAHVPLFRTIALHGGYLTPGDLRRDMGDPDWVDDYLPTASKIKLPTHTPLVLIGYSLGGSLIGHLSHFCRNIVAVVLYESPLIGLKVVAGSFPVLWVRNRYTSTAKRERKFDDTKRIWQRSHRVDEMTGQGRHVAWRFGWPPFGHAWDQSLNPLIDIWINHQLLRIESGNVGSFDRC